ncbi:hypothetical protein [Erysipelatoclostridium sp. DFI.2.3]|nr:hypothetical protein [Erysipelatoclostridium sp. DFI.2.3]
MNYSKHTLSGIQKKTDEFNFKNSIDFYLSPDYTIDIETESPKL